MTITGKTGADAIFIALKGICRVLVKYEAKLQILIDELVTSGAITSSQATTARTFISTATTVCAIFDIIAFNSNIN